MTRSSWPGWISINDGAPTSGSYELTADGDIVVVQRGAQNFFRAPASSLASIEVVGTDGDEVVSFSKLPDAFTGPVIADAKAGNDTLRLVGPAQALDLTAIPDAQLQGFETIDIAGDGDNSLKLNVTEVLNLSSTTNTLLVRSNRGDTLDVGAGWTIADTVVESGVFLRVLTQGAASLRLAGPNDWTNPILRLDVNANSTIEPQDVLVIINELNDPRFSDSVRALVNAASLADFPNFYYDTNSDGFAAPQDALVVINFLNGGGGPEGEGSGGSWDLDTTAVDWIFSQANDELTRENSLSVVAPPTTAVAFYRVLGAAHYSFYCCASAP